MKNKKPIFLLIFFTAIILTSCASKEKPPRERDETFVADISEFEIGTLHLYAAFGVNKPKICDFDVIFYPRSNYINFRSKIGIDIVEFCFSYPERQNFSEARDKYLEMYNSGNLPTEKPNKKNALSNGNIYIGWGAFGPTNQAYAPYYTNVNYILDNKPYFRILFEQSKDLENSGNSSPRISVYISPAQWEQITQICDQAVLEAQADEILAQADAF